MNNWIKAIRMIGGVFLALILFHVIWPVQMRLEPNGHFVSSVRDENNHLLTLFAENTILDNQLQQEELKVLNAKGKLNKFPIVPVLSYNELPESYVYFLTKIENKHFFDFGKDNLYGFSLSGLARLFKGKASGGSNIPQQLLKNAIHKKDGLGTIYLSRKYGEQLAAFQMMKSATPEEILVAYTNYSGNFWYERDFSGLILASYAIFDRPPHELNDLEMLLTVKTLKGGRGLKELCNERFSNRKLIKERMLAYFELIADPSESDRERLAAMRRMEIRFAESRTVQNTSSLTHFLSQQRGSEIDRFAIQYISSITNKRQEKLQLTVDRFSEKFRSQLAVNGFELQLSLIAIDIETGAIEGTLGNRKNDAALANLIDYGQGFQCGSVLKPLVFLELFEDHNFGEDTRLYNGDLKQFDYNPSNVKNTLLGKKVPVRDILKYSLNKAAVNHREYTDPMKVAQGVEEHFSQMNITASPDHPWGASYVLGTRTLTPWEVAQAYQMLFNEGKAIALSPWKYMIDPHLQDTIFDIGLKKRKNIYTATTANRIKDLMSAAFEPKGTCHRLLQWLPKNRTYYGKTGTTGKAKDGWTVLSDGKKLLVVWAGYMQVANGVITRKGAPSIPSKSGAGSAGVLAAMAYTEIYGAD